MNLGFKQKPFNNFPIHQNPTLSTTEESLTPAQSNFQRVLKKVMAKRESVDLENIGEKVWTLVGIPFWSISCWDSDISPFSKHFIRLLIQ